MGFFDLNIPYAEPSQFNKATVEATRTKLVVKAMELGYSGIAHNRTIKGVMSDQHRCAISRLTLSSLLKLAPSLSSSVKLHRELLGVSLSAPFHQYTRLTVCVDSVSQSQVLNAGNPILKTYDLVAVRPLNQTAFDKACETMKVDIIAIDFSDKLPFRLKQPMVKTAIKRGVFFEITYSDLILDIQKRRQLIANAKLLVDWTRGGNLILSSAALSVTELRGPNDVANLSLLLGISMERAKAAVSKNCRTLIANALRKKQFYKEAIKVEVIPLEAQPESNKTPSTELLNWDPLSPGEGDLHLDDMAKCFSGLNKTSANVKSIDFASDVDSMSSKGFRVKDLTLSSESVSPPILDGTAKDCLPVAEANELITVTDESTYHLERYNSLSDLASNAAVLPEQNTSSALPISTTETSKNDELLTLPEQNTILASSAAVLPEQNTSSSLRSSTTETSKNDEIQILPEQNTILASNAGVLPVQNTDSALKDSALPSSITETSKNDKSMILTTATNAELYVPSDADKSCALLEGESYDPMSDKSFSTGEFSVSLLKQNVKPLISSMDNLMEGANEIHERGDTLICNLREYRKDAVVDFCMLGETNKSLPDVGGKSDVRASLNDVPMPESLDGEVSMHDRNMELIDEQIPTIGTKHEVVFSLSPVSPDATMAEEKHEETYIKTDQHLLVQCVEGRATSKRRTKRNAFLFPLKHFLNPVTFKRKPHRRKRRIKNM